MTYLQAINEVLKRLREDTVGTVDYSSYSSLISTFVNDAKREVENAWNWRVLMQEFHLATINGGSLDYDIEGLIEPEARLAYDDCKKPMVYDVTENDELQLEQYSYDRWVRRYKIDPDGLAENHKPSFFAVNKDSDSQWRIYFDGAPDVYRHYKIWFYVPQDELTLANTEILVPWRPVVHLALLYALDERGEEIGEPGSKAWRRFDKSLGDAIAMDSVGDSSKITFDA